MHEPFGKLSYCTTKTTEWCAYDDLDEGSKDGAKRQGDLDLVTELCRRIDRRVLALREQMVVQERWGRIVSSLDLR